MDDGDDILQHIVVGDETWYHHFQPKGKSISMQWKHPDSPRPKKFKDQQSTGKSGNGNCNYAVAIKIWNEVSLNWMGGEWKVERNLGLLARLSACSLPKMSTWVSIYYKVQVLWAATIMFVVVTISWVI
ncbi:hypothetical protein TNCV_2395651 [Trichonephila clavipes]|nr:hypothetical protein TNCV_2395651 [Trichonephila clavipes]